MCPQGVASYELIKVRNRNVNQDLKEKAPVLGRCGKVLVVGGVCCRDGICEKMPEASTMLDETDANRLQDEPAAGQG